MKTKAAVLYKTNKSLIIEELEIPELQFGQVLVKILYSGICHSQLNEIKGLKGEDKYLPHTLGHEGSGIVKNIGKGVTLVKPGDFVILSWIKGPGLDAPSSYYIKDGEKKINSGAISTFTQFAIISENRLTKITSKMPPDKAALLGCAVPTGAGIVMNTLKVKEDNSIAIFGIGGVGLSALFAAVAMNCKRIIAIDINDQKLKIAEKLGATYTINPKHIDVLDLIKDITDGVGVDYAVEAAGVKETMELAFESIRTTGTAVIAGNLKQNEKISIDPFDLIKGKRLLGSWGGETKPEHDIPLYVEMYLSGKMNLDKMISQEYKLEKINEAFTDLENGNVIRPLINMNL
jgi:S-(hydroxymethyl)glutathione dehydrogenase/alcohol dehydrogenase